MWSTKMTAYLMHTGIWDTVTTAQPSPGTYTEAASAAAIANREEICDWKKNNMQALGSIHLCLSTSVTSHLRHPTNPT